MTRTRSRSGPRHILAGVFLLGALVACVVVPQLGPVAYWAGFGLLTVAAVIVGRWEQ